MIDALAKLGRRNRLIANGTAVPVSALASIIDTKLVSRNVTSHIGTNPQTQRQMIAGEMQVELAPQGTLVERIARASLVLAA